MFDHFMERSLPLWLLISALVPAVVAAMLIGAAFRIRHLRALLADANRRTREGAGREPDPPWQSEAESQDWVARKG